MVSECRENMIGLNWVGSVHGKGKKKIDPVDPTYSNLLDVYIRGVILAVPS